MASPVTLRDVLPASYGNVVIVAAGSVCLASYLRTQVLIARKRYNIEPPIMFSPEINTFNCIQLAYLNYMEHYPLFITTLLLSGINTPRLSALSGLVYLIGRYQYARGYYTGVASRRIPGAMISGGALALLTACTFYFGFTHSTLSDALISVGEAIFGTEISD